jgi:predicted exporter
MMAFAWRNKAVLLWALGLLAAVGVIARSSFTTDMGAFLPQNPSKQQQLLVDNPMRLYWPEEVTQKG